MPRSRASAVAIGLLLIAGCSADTGARAAETPATFHAPPRPGSSITHSTMCRCRVCSTAGCCGGAAEPGAGDPVKRCEGYDFGAAGCELSVGSCSARCYEATWRVQGPESCAQKRPAACCEPLASVE